MRLPCAQFNSQGQPATISDQMQFGGEAAATTPERVIVGLGTERWTMALIFPPRPLHACVPGRLSHQYTRASTRSHPVRRARAGSAEVLDPTTRSASSFGSGCTRSATGHSARAGRATALRCASIRASHSGWSGDHGSSGPASRVRAAAAPRLTIPHPSAHDGVLRRAPDDLSSCATSSHSTAND